MKCPICGKQTLPGAKLCSPCRAALKRAKDDSVWVMPPGAGAARPVAAAGAADAEAASAHSAGGTRLGGWRGVALGIAALFVAAGVLATVRLVQVDGPAAVDRPAATAAAQPIAAPAPSAPEVLDLPTIAPRGASAVATPAVDAEPAPARPRERAPRPRPAVEPPPPPPPEVVEAPPPEPAPATVVERPVPAKPVDPWQRMSESLARCAAQELFARLGCEHRVRATYCDGSWGRVPQCPGGLPTDHGQ